MPNQQHKDVIVGDYIRPWNADENTKGMRRGIPESQYWAYDEADIDQVGSGEWEGFPDNSHDGQVKGIPSISSMLSSIFMF